MRDETKKILREILSDNQQAGAKTLKDALRKRARAGYGPDQTLDQYNRCMSKKISAKCHQTCRDIHNPPDMTPMIFPSKAFKECLASCDCLKCRDEYNCRKETYLPDGGAIPVSWERDLLQCMEKVPGCTKPPKPNITPDSKGLPGVNPISIK
jgi:hypothetical protein